MSYFLNKQIPWKDIIITGHVVDGKGDKYSKSQGNATLPDKVLEQHEISGIRFWSNSGALGSNMQLDYQRLHMGWKLRNKFINAKRFIDMQLKDNKLGTKAEYFDLWLKEKEKIDTHLDSFEFNLAGETLYRFFWNTFCDIWIEESKKTPITDTLNAILNDLNPIMDLFC